MNRRDAAVRSGHPRLGADLLTAQAGRPQVSWSHALRPCFVLALAAGLAGCQDSAVGTIKADRRAAEQLQRAVSDRPAPPSKSKSSRNRPDVNDLSPKFRGGESQP
jgi:hypothetical protein